MSWALLALRLGLAAVFAVAAIAKLRDVDRFRALLDGLGVPAPRVVALAVPALELAVAALLVPAASARSAAAAAGTLLLLFSAALLRLLRRGEPAECNCFGARRATPVRPRALARNAGLLAVAVAIAAGGGGHALPTEWLGMRAALALVAGVVAAQAVFSWQLFAQNGRLLARVASLEGDGGDPRGLDVGAEAPPFAVADLDGTPTTLDDVLDPRLGVLLVFSDPGCTHCTPLLPALAAAQRRPGIPVEMISAGDVSLNRARAEEHGLARVLLQDGFEVSERYRLYGAPAAVLVGADGRVAAGPVEGRRAVSELLAGVA
jgi:peroxiredoxin